MPKRLDAHGEELLQQYRNRLPVFERLERLAFIHLNNALDSQGICVNSIEHRIKAEKSLIGKLELKGAKYHSLDDVTDILGIRIITYYTDDVDKVAAIVKGTFDVDWQESVDKRRLHTLNSFGYNSLHYICRLPKSVIDDPDMPELNEYRFELQMRTALQHVWSTIEHDTGYKGGVKMPDIYRRQFSRLAGMLELIDDEFSRLRTTLNDYRRQIQSFVLSGQLDDVPLDSDTFKSYLKVKPFNRLNQRIAAANQAEIMPVSLLPFIPVLESFQMQTLGDVQRFVDANAEDAYQLALSQLSFTDLDIVSETIGLQNLCIVYVLKNGGGMSELKTMFDLLHGPRNDNERIAEIAFRQASSLPFMQRATPSKS